MEHELPEAEIIAPNSNVDTKSRISIYDDEAARIPIEFIREWETQHESLEHMINTSVSEENRDIIEIVQLRQTRTSNAFGGVEIPDNGACFDEKATEIEKKDYI